MYNKMALRQDPYLKALVGNPARTVVGNPFNNMGCPPIAANLGQYNMECASSAAMLEDRARRAALYASLPKVGLAANSAGLVAPGDTATIAVAPSVGLCVTGFTVSRANGSFFLIHSMTSGRRQWLADGDPIHAEVFSTDTGCCPVLEWPWLDCGCEIKLTIENIAAESHRFFAVYWGIPSDGPGSCVG